MAVPFDSAAPDAAPAFSLPEAAAAPDSPDSPERALGFAGASNFRDLGGYAGDGGRPVRWRTLFRSDHLAGLTEADAQAMGRLGIRRALDFRGAAERAAVGYTLAGVAQHSLPIEPTVVQQLKSLLAAGEAITPERTVALMQDTYRAFATDGAAPFATLFEHLLDNDAPLVFHCTAGKDRTGFAAAMILLALGVSRETVMQDYLLTNELYRLPDLERSRTPREVLAVLWRVQQEFLDAALQAVERDHGSVERYLAGSLGVGEAERARLRELYLQK